MAVTFVSHINYDAVTRRVPCQKSASNMTLICRTPPLPTSSKAALQMPTIDHPFQAGLHLELDKVVSDTFPMTYYVDPMFYSFDNLQEISYDEPVIELFAKG